MHRDVLFVEEKEWIQSDRVLSRSRSTKGLRLVAILYIRIQS